MTAAQAPVACTANSRDPCPDTGLIWGSAAGGQVTVRDRAAPVTAVDPVRAAAVRVRAARADRDAVKARVNLDKAVVTAWAVAPDRAGADQTIDKVVQVPDKVPWVRVMAGADLAWEEVQGKAVADRA
ncbi:MAG: hypothetical protein QNJ78_02770 [Gammaproteobacteria bacterium]|nr:hypothetical protein [Gammaproteobacteria bacterium]